MSDPRSRPSDPAGTQPKVDPRSLELGKVTFLPAPVGLAPGVPPVELEPSPPKALELSPRELEPTPPRELEPTPPRGLEPTPPRGLEPTPPRGLEPTPPKAQEPASAAAPTHPTAPRFQFLFGALGALGICAIGVAVLLISAPKSTPAKPWSAWHPTNDGVDPAQQIAAHVAPNYKLDDGRQIVRITGGPPSLKGQPMTLGEIRSGSNPHAWKATACCIGCAGAPATVQSRRASLQSSEGCCYSREALELALYTFRYVGGVNQVVVTIPPAPTSAAKHALMFRSQDVATELGHPLTYTLAAVTPRVSQMDRSIDAPLVKELTGARLYDYWVDEVPQSGAVMLLEPPARSRGSRAPGDAGSVDRLGLSLSGYRARSLTPACCVPPVGAGRCRTARPLAPCGAGEWSGRT